jgi:hypothetical protein
MKNSMLRLLFLILIGAANSKANIITLTIDSLNQETQFVSATNCDTILVVNNSNYTDYFFTDTLSGGVGNFDLQIQPDSIFGQWGNGVSYFLDLNGLTSLAIAHQLHTIYFYINIESCFPASVLKPLLKSKGLFPNPAKNMIFVETEINDVNISITNSKGENVLTLGINNQNTAIKIDQLENGLYYLKTTNDQGVFRYQRFFKID